jgi:hypothetical protein
MAHKHAQLMMEYAKDAAETDKPWRRWEFRTGDEEPWMQFSRHPEWDINHEYRRKPNQAQIDAEAFNSWYELVQHNHVFPSDAWASALRWERSKK